MSWWRDDDDYNDYNEAEIKQVFLFTIFVVIIALYTFIGTGCNLVQVQVHQSARQVDSDLGNDDAVSLIRGSDTVIEEDNLDVPLELK